jgi:hypothetical protein
MSNWRSIQCPACGDAIGSLLPEHTNMGIQCEHKVINWTSREVGFDKKTQKTKYEFECHTSPGCGGVLNLCAHGCRVCASCPPQFTPADEWPIAPYVPYSVLLRRDVEATNQRKESERMAANYQGAPPQIDFKAPTGRVQLPFLGEAEPSRYTPPRSRRKKADA